MKLSDQQLDVMAVLWSRGEATTAEVHEGLDQDLAYTTVATLLRRLEDKGAVAHRNEGRQFVYRACVEEQDVRRGMVRNLVDRLFRGDSAALVSHLLGDRSIEADELQRIEALLKEKGGDDE